MPSFLTDLSSISREFIDILAPARCLSCLQENTWLCQSCLASIRPIELTCVVCGQAKAAGLTCHRCRRKCPLTGVVSVSPYSSHLIRRGIHWLKFKGIKELAHPLAILLIPQLIMIAPLPRLRHQATLVPVPLHPRRLRDRGFNQSLEIANVISAYTKIPVINAVQRQHMTFTQAKMPRDLREQNVNAAFTLTTPLPPDRQIYIVIDDVTTSGSTLSAVAQVLRTASAQQVQQVWGATIARG